MTTERLRQLALGTWASRYLAAGYVVATITYRDRDLDPQSREPIADVLAAIEYCPVLIIEGDAANPLNEFNRQTVIAGLRAAGKVLEIRSYAGQPHSFAFYSDRDRTPQPAVALKAFDEIDSFLNQHLPTRPSPVDATLVDRVPF